MSIISPSHIASKFGIELTGVIHVGAHEGQEIPEYLDLGLKRICLFEANDEHAPILDLYAERHSEITVQYVAISDRNGSSAFHVMSNSEASSLLELKVHAEVYPDIKNLSRKVVETKTLDSLYSNGSAFGINLLNIDIQGSELSALKGAERLLDQIEIVIVEVNFAEMYEGCPLIEEIDLFLFDKGLIRVETSTPFDPTWGDAAYVRSALVRDISLITQERRHLVTMSNLGSNGRFANQLFQYLFIILYGLRSGCKPVLPTFDAKGFLNQPLTANDAVTLSKLPWLESAESSFIETKNPARNVDISGYFQGVPAAYRTHKHFIKRLLKPNSHLETAGRNWLEGAQLSFKRIIGLHIRRGDYVEYDGHNAERFSRVPTEIYLDWLRENIKVGDGVFISTDDPDEIDLFSDFPILNNLLPRPSLISGREGDFHLLSQCDLVAYCNSSFSMMSALLAKDGQQASMISFSDARFVPFDPWNEDWFWTRFMSLRGGIPEDWHDENVAMSVSLAEDKNHLAEAEIEIENITTELAQKNHSLHEMAVDLGNATSSINRMVAQISDLNKMISSPASHLIDYYCSRILGSETTISVISRLSFRRSNLFQRLCFRARKNYKHYENLGKIVR